MKTVLAPNAPWPKWVEPAKRAKRTKRAKPSEVDAKFAAWWNSQTQENIVAIYEIFDSYKAKKENTHGIVRRR